MKDLIFEGKLVIGIDHGYGNMKTRNRRLPSYDLSVRKSSVFSMDFEWHQSGAIKMYVALN